ncbi:MAG TPA: ribulose-phosphate 3-epimerase [Solirubrobacteraceae bacterium]|jgi:ribulose-phosphate 3-epimerase
MNSEILSRPQVAPSILAADFARLGAQVAEVLDAGARVIHVDVMDGHFVPEITMGPIVVQALAEQVKAAGGLLDVHLMIERPERHVAEFITAGAHAVTFHTEATPHISYTANLIKEHGALVGVAINPATPVGALQEIGELIDIALCMTVNPGWGGQSFIASSPGKIRRLAQNVDERVAIQVDGGVDATTAPLCAQAGARLFVAGSAIFRSPDPGEAYTRIVDSLSGS